MTYKHCSATAHIFGLVTLIVSIPVTSCSKPEPMSGATAWVGGQAFEALAVEGVTASEGMLVASVPGSGTLLGVREAAVVSQTQGVITAVSFTAGDRVRQGQTLVRLDDSLAVFNLKRAQDQLDAAALDLRATTILSETGGTSASNLARAQSAESAARSAYEQAKKLLSDATIVAPIDGIIAGVDARIVEGNVIGAFTPITRVVDDSAFRVTVGIGEGQIGRVSPSLPAKVLIPAAFGDTYVDATVLAVGGGADSQTGSYPVIVGFPNAWGNRLKSGMSAKVEIRPAGGGTAVIAPLAALVRRGESYALFVAVDGKARVREVDLGAANGVRTEIIRGVTTGETIIVSALSRLVDGSPVRVTIRGDSASRE